MAINWYASPKPRQSQGTDPEACLSTSELASVPPHPCPHSFGAISPERTNVHSCTPKPSYSHLRKLLHRTVFGISAENDDETWEANILLYCWKHRKYLPISLSVCDFLNLGKISGRDPKDKFFWWELVISATLLAVRVVGASHFCQFPVWAG